MKRYTIRYFENDKAVITAVSNWSDLNDLLNGSAKDSFVESRISQKMPLDMHKLMSDHNKKLLNP